MKPDLGVLLGECSFRLAQKGKKRLAVKGRIDILHRSLLLVLDSPLKEYFTLHLYFSIVKNKETRLFQVDPIARLPRSEKRFEGLIKQVLAEGKLKNKLIVEKEYNALKKYKKVVFQENGEFCTIKELMKVFGKLIKGTPLLLVIGCFPKGGFTREYKPVKTISVYQKVLTSSSVIAIILASLLLGVQEGEFK